MMPDGNLHLGQEHIISEISQLINATCTDILSIHSSARYCKQLQAVNDWSKRIRGDQAEEETAQYIGSSIVERGITMRTILAASQHEWAT